jgi:hypothetical protein
MQEGAEDDDHLLPCLDCVDSGVNPQVPANKVLAPESRAKEPLIRYNGCVFVEVCDLCCKAGGTLPI